MAKWERVSMVKAMEFICRQINDQDVFDEWLLDGVADGDIVYGDLGANDEYLDCYVNDKTFSVLLSCFLRCMSAANKSGGLYCDGVVGENDEDEEDDEEEE